MPVRRVRRAVAGGPDARAGGQDGADSGGDHLVTVAERVTSFDELLTTLVDAVLAKISMQQNNDMRKITAYAGLISVPTMIAGIYGMNFDFMPELHWSFGYPLVWTVIGVICFVLYRNFRRNHWL